LELKVVSRKFLIFSDSFIQPNYPYMENSFGSVPQAAGEDGKAPIHIKEELGKELPSPDGLKPVSCL
jgi:hypothetical protein